VDDNQLNRFILGEYLRWWGCSSQEAANTDEALAVLSSANSHFDLILLDVQMPGKDGFECARLIRENPALATIPIIILTSLGFHHEGLNEQMRQQISSYLAKPIQPAELHTAIVQALSGTKEKKAPEPLPDRFHGRETAPPRTDFKILLVEDYPTNQQVAMAYLSKGGYDVRLAENGQEAIIALMENPFDLILMDVQMPVLDGMQATREIRQLERAKELPTSAGLRGERIPIIAMTAHAMKGDKEKCLAAGMDDYIAKPLKKEELLRIIRKWTNRNNGDSLRTPESDAEIPGGDENAGSSPIDFAYALSEFDGDRKVLVEIIGIFSRNVSKQLMLIRNAIQENNSEVVRMEGHSIKGGAANLRAVKLAAVAYELEQIGKANRLEKAAPALADLEQEFNLLLQYLRDTQDITVELSFSVS
jgi:CheY-like chemotaxis protein/HPt (histidine-containing phosphotransfer) domain-containing protein